MINKNTGEYKVLRSKSSRPECRLNIQIQENLSSVSIRIGKLILKDLLVPLMIGNDKFWGHYYIDYNDSKDIWRLRYISPFTDYKKEEILIQQAFPIEEDYLGIFNVIADCDKDYEPSSISFVNRLNNLISDVFIKKTENFKYYYYELPNISFEIKSDEFEKKLGIHKHEILLYIGDTIKSLKKASEEKSNL